MKNNKPETPFEKMFRKFYEGRGFHRLGEAVTQFYPLVLKESVANVTQKYGEIKEKYSLNRPLRMRDFYRICRREGIRVFFEESTIGKELGYYGTSKDGSIRMIRINPELRGLKRRRVAAHELAHHFLHRERMMAGERLYWPDYERSRGRERTEEEARQDGEGLIAEMDADALASLLLTTGVKK
jgi:hypothetical protein